MSWDSWSCINVENGPGLLSDKVRSVLKMAACNLYIQGKDRMKISTDVCDGIIQTEWNTHTLGTCRGVLFKTQLDQDDGDFFVNFLLNVEDLKRGGEMIRQMEERGVGEWEACTGRIPIPELYQFRDLRKRHLH